MIDRISQLENKCNGMIDRICHLENKCKNLAAEKESLARQLKELERPSEDEELGDVQVLLGMKKFGFKRLNPQEPPINQEKSKTFSCKECDSTLESKVLLDAHMESNHKKMPESRCDICGTVFWTEIQLKTHKKTHHAKESFKNQQFNCNDCPFQGETGLELKNHIQRTKHTLSENIECYTCKKEFRSYWSLINHRKTDQPSSRKCRYFLNDDWRFDAETCWYKHVDESKHENKEKDFSFQCNVCDNKFDLNADLMKRKKNKSFR